MPPFSGRLLAAVLLGGAALLPVHAATLSVPVPSDLTPLSAPAATLPGLSAALSSARTADGRLTLSLSVKNAGPATVALTLSRHSDQNCAFAPLIRVLRVGTREVVYPVAGAEPRLCTQEVQGASLGAGESTSFSRTLDLPPGDYVVEGWLSALAGAQPVRVPAAPLRLTLAGARSGLTLQARLPQTVKVGASVPLSLLLTNTSAQVQAVPTRLCPVRVELRDPVSGALRFPDHQPTYKCPAPDRTRLLQPGQSTLYSWTVPSIPAAGRYRLDISADGGQLQAAPVTLQVK
ncbi:hypothetical protein [Deinococcus sonorensis]|uniref:DUF11 domain-containing protein n=2 Tax=Deinococcus sonorensis TaxID=309891 RepID=A0AAU7U8E6_9DEIO